MKKKNLFMMACAAFLFAACSESLPDGGGDGGGVDNTDGEAWVSLNVRTGGTTKSLNTPDTENGTADETKVNEMMVVFFDNHVDTPTPDPSVVDVKLWGSGDPEISTPGQGGGTATSAFKVKKTAKAFMVVLNPSTEFKTAANASSAKLSTVNAAIVNTDVTSVIGSGKNNFMMTNAKGKLEPTKITDTGGSVDVEDIDLVTYPTAGEAENKPQQLTVDRVAAKVRLFADANYTGNSIDVTTVGWALNVTNKKYFPMSERSKTWMETPAAGGRGTCVSPYDIWKFGSYREDPNFDGQKTSMPNIGASPYTDNYEFYTQADATINNKWSDATAGPSTGPNASKIPALYCLENTQEEADNYQAYTTHVLLKATIAPTGLTLPNNGGVYDGTTNSDADVDDSGKVISGKDWIKVGSGYYSYGLLIKYIEAELVSKYKSDDSDNFPTSLTTTFNIYLTYLKGKSVVGVDAVALLTKEAFTTKYGSSDSQIEAGAKELAESFKQAGVSTHGADSYGSVSYYKGGDSYYTIMIKHDNDEVNTNNKLGEFGVVRNSVYDITINSIKNPGYPTIPPPDTDKKDEEEEAFLSIEININPWTWYTQGVDL